MAMPGLGHGLPRALIAVVAIGLALRLATHLRGRVDAMVARGEDVRPFCRRQFKIEPFFRRSFSQQGIEFDPPREPWEEELLV